MSGTVTFPPKTCVKGWISRDLLFIISGPHRVGPLSKYKFHMLIEAQGKTIYEDPLDSPDPYGRIIARDKDLDIHGGTIIVAGMYYGSFNGNRFNPLISGRCGYTTKIHGMLIFTVNPIVVVTGSNSSTIAAGTTTSDATVSVTGTATVAPGGVGGSASTAISQPGDQKSSSVTDGQIRNMTSVQGLEVTQVAAPKA